MLMRRGVLAAAAISLVALSAAVAATEDDQTHPSVRPKEGKRHTRFVVRFTLRTDPGVNGATETSYRVVVARPGKQKARCEPPAPDPVTSGAAGDVKRVVLPEPGRGWCRGKHRVTVFVERGPYCPSDSEPCPKFPTEQRDTGHARFHVRRQGR